MSVVLPPFESRLRDAVARYWLTLEAQAARQRKGGIKDHGRRAAVTGGKQMDGFCELVNWLLKQNGIPDAHIFVRDRREIPGYFRATKDWDMLVVHEDSGAAKHLLAAIEFKSQRGPSFGNNLNNRAEEALGTAVDVRTAFREGAFGSSKPWLGWIMLLEDCEGSTRVVNRLEEPHFKVFPDFRGSSYAKRYEILLRKLVLENHYDAAALMLSKAGKRHRGAYAEPSPDLTMKNLLAGLAGHVAGAVAALK